MGRHIPETTESDTWTEQISRKTFLENVRKRRKQNRKYRSGTSEPWENGRPHQLTNAEWGFESIRQSTGPRRNVSNTRW